jgi:hypothetical protein
LDKTTQYILIVMVYKTTTAINILVLVWLKMHVFEGDLHYWDVWETFWPSRKMQLCLTLRPSFKVMWSKMALQTKILPYLEHNAYLHQIVYSYWVNRWWSHWDTTDAAVQSVHSGEFPLHYNVDSFCASEIAT